MKEKNAYCILFERENTERIRALNCSYGKCRFLSTKNNYSYYLFVLCQCTCTYILYF